jgi:undecaprenyl-diphosphatase
MIEWLEGIDRDIVLWINAWHSPWLDELMWIISGRILWIPVYIGLFFLAFKEFGIRKALWFVAIAGVTVIVADLISVHLIKDVVQRYRPSHNLLLVDRLHFYEIRTGEYYQGGKFGFVSSHATNFFALAVFIGNALKHRYNWLFPVLLAMAILICISRMYLGAHYASDLIGGAILGSTMAWISWRYWWKPYFADAKTA